MSAVLAAMLDLKAGDLDVTVRVYPSLEQFVGLPKKLNGIEVLTTGKSIESHARTNSGSWKACKKLAALLGW